MGGPVSSAATVHKGLAEIMGLSHTEDELAAIGRVKGAMSRLFIRNRSTVMEGIGDKLFSVTTPDMWYLNLLSLIDFKD